MRFLGKKGGKCGENRGRNMCILGSREFFLQKIYALFVKK